MRAPARATVALSVRIAALSAATALLLGGCASARDPSDQLLAAREAYRKVEQDPDVARSAAEPLEKSRRALDQADSMLTGDAEMVEVNHQAYLAERYAEIAREEAKQARLQKEVEQARERRQQVRLELEQREAQQARNKASALQEQLADLQARKTDRGVVLTLGDVLFDFNRAQLKPGGERAARRLADFLREYPERRIRVEGYTDSIGSEAYNHQLSQQRAEAVKQAIVRDGIDPGRIVTEGYGESYPVASNASEAGRQRNRRVEVVISDADGRLEAR